MRVFLLLLVFSIATLYAQPAKTLTIGVLSDSEFLDGGVLANKMKEEIQAVMGGNTDVVFQETQFNNYDLVVAKNNYQQLLKTNVDIILSFGVVNHIMLEQAASYNKPVLIVGTVNTDFGELKNRKITSGISNLTYLIAPISYEEDLDTFIDLYPFQNVGIVVDEYLLEALPVKSFFDNYFAKKQQKYTLIPVKSSADIISQLDSGIDAIYLAGGFHQTNEAQFLELINEINERKLPSFSSFSKQDVVRGILATNQPEANFDRFFRRIALDIEAISTGTNAKDLPVFVSYDNKLSINYSTAKQIEFPLRYSLLAVADFIGGTNAKQSENTYSIVDIMKTVVEKNPGLDAERKNIDLATQDVKSAKSNFLPNVGADATGVYIDPKVAELSAGNNPEFSTSASVGVDQLLYSESAAAGIDIQKNLQKAQEEVYNTAELDAILNAGVAYFNALILKTNAQIQNQNLQVTKQNLNIADQNFRAGESAKSDVLRFQSQMAQNTQSLIDADNQLRQAFNTINQIMNQPIMTSIDIEDAEMSSGVFLEYNYLDLMEVLDDPKLRPKLVQFMVAEAKKNAPELKNITYNAEAIERNYKLNDYGRFIPTVALSGKYNLALSQSGKGSTLPVGVPNIPDGTYNLGLNISLPIFQQNQRNIGRQTARIQQDQLAMQRQNTELTIDRNVNDIMLDLINQIANIEISKIAEQTAKESLDLTQNAYAEGAVPLIQLIDAQVNYLQSQLASATANYNYMLTSLQLERAIGYFFLMNTKESNQSFLERAKAYILSDN